MSIDYASGPCEYNPVGEHYVARFRPAGLGTNGPNTTLSFLTNGYAMNYTRLDGLYDPVYVLVEAKAIGTGFGTFPAYVKFVNQEPAVISSTTRFINVTGQIHGYDYTPGCIIRFRMSLQPDNFN
jgi:hypothetical protein